MNDLVYQTFSNTNLNDPFFDSLKSDYKEFSNWFHKKSNNYAYVLYGDNSIDGFLYLKEENEITDISTPIYNKKILKVGTFKFNSKGTLRGQRFIKKILDVAISNKKEMIYLTIFKKYEYLIKLFQAYGFYKIGEKQTQNGIEFVYARDINSFHGDIILDYPFIYGDTNKYLLSIYPDFHTRLFPESKLINESPDIVKDVSHSNSIHKIYISGAHNAMDLNRGDILVIYRTNDGRGSAYYRSVISSVCVVEEVKNINEFPTLDSYLKYCSKFSIFSDQELTRFYEARRYPYIIRFTYNLALNKRINRKELIDNKIISSNTRIILEPISDSQFYSIFRVSKSDESFIINKT